MFFLITIIEFVEFPSRNDIVIASSMTNKNDLKIASSGSIGQYYSGKCHPTYPNFTVAHNSKSDWCSNIASFDDPMPWISFSLKNKAIKVTGYSLRNGCCWYDCCCLDDNHRYDYDFCCCRLYSFSFQGSNDNTTWTTIHKVENDNEYWVCLFKTFTFPKTQPFSYLRLVLDDPYPGCPKCLQINEIQIYGEEVHSLNDFESDDDNEESVSIIGKVKQT